MFSKNLNRKLKYNKFDLSHEFKFTCDMGKLIPVMVREVVPGDKLQIAHQALIRLTAQVAPVMHKVDVYFRTFYVPNRILWSNWDNFITGGQNNSDTSEPPYIEVTNAQLSSLYDYMGVPTGIQEPLKVSALPFRAYNMICNYYFRDQNLQSDLPTPDTDAIDDASIYELQNVLWRKGYFTSANSAPQAGIGASFSLGGQAPVLTTNDFTRINVGIESSEAGHLGNTGFHSDSYVPGMNAYTTYMNATGPAAIDTDYVDGRDTNLRADLSAAGNIPIETLRNAFKVQSYLEKLQRAGYHMKDWLLSFFGVNVHDSRLQMPEYIGGNKQSLLFSEILQTSETATTALGTQAGTSTTFTNLKFYNKFVEEYGWVMTLMYIRPIDEYSQGIERQLTRETKFDYYIPEFANLGEQAILNKELYAQGTSDDNKVFGYQTRYAEYHSVENRVAGLFKDNGAFKAWTLTRDFESLPTLNENFINCDPSKRIYATQGYDNHILVDCANYLYARRKMPKYVVPATL